MPSEHGPDLRELVHECGEPFGLMPYGLEAMVNLRIEKGRLLLGSSSTAG